MTTIADFQIIRKLGDGAFSSVFSVKRISDGSIYAMKKVKMGKLSEREKENALNEIRILASISHPNVVAYKEAFFENKEGCLCIVMEQADNGDLLQTIDQHKKKRTKFSENEIWHIFIQIVRGLKALHDLKIVHRDIKCANIFLTKDGKVKLGDLNVSKVAKKGLLKTQTGTPYYASPEVWKDKPYDFKSDIWSLGCVLYEMITLSPPFTAQSMSGLAQRVIKGNFDKIPAQFSSDLSKIVNHCLQVDPSNRLSSSQILLNQGLLNHQTELLQQIDAENCQKKEILLSTIRCPRNLGMIAERLPAPQYKPLKRSNSLANVQNEEAKKNNSLVNSDQIDSKMSNPNQKNDQKFIGKAVERQMISRQNVEKASQPQNGMYLPVIIEDSQDYNHSNNKNKDIRQKNNQVSQMSSKPPIYQKKENLRQSEDKQIAKIQSQQIAKDENKVLKNIENYERIPKSVEISNNKAKAQYLNQVIPMKQYNSGQNAAGYDYPSRVHSQSQQKRIQSSEAYLNQLYQNQRLPSNKNADQMNQHYSIENNELPKLQRNPEYKKQSHDYDPPQCLYNYKQIAATPLMSSRVSNGNRKNMQSVEIMGSMGLNRKYEGVESAIRMARELSRENLQQINSARNQYERGLSANQQYSYEQRDNYSRFKQY